MIKVVYLGTSAAAPAWSRGLPSIALVVDGSIYLFDVGECTQERLQEAGLSPHKIKAIFVTHAHGDHFFGLPGLLQFMTLSGRRERLYVIAPVAIRDFIETSERVAKHIRSYELDFRVVHVGKVYEDDRVVVEAFPVCHSRYGIEAYGYKLYPKPKLKLNRSKLERLGLKPGPILSRLKRGEEVVIGGKIVKPSDVFRLEKPSTSIVYTGDTRPCISTVRAARGATLLIHDATFSLNEANEAREKGHSTAYEAGLVARLARVECLALFHVSARYRDTKLLVEEARMAGVKCVYVAEPLMTHILEA